MRSLCSCKQSKPVMMGVGTLSQYHKKISKISFEVHINFDQIGRFLLEMTLAHRRKTKIKHSIPHMPSQNSLKY